MMNLSPLDVLRIDDDTIEPPGPKMVVCIHPVNGWFYRINTKPHWRPSILLPREPNHLFLKHDSYLECGDPLELDDFIIEASLRRPGVIGTVSRSHCADISRHLSSARTLKAIDRDAIRVALGLA